MRIDTAYLSDAGGREKNDDTVCIVREENRICVFVGDGLGGYDGGRVASETAAETVMAYQKENSLLEESHMRNAAMLADEAVKTEQVSRRGNMKTTMVVLEIEEEQARWMHVGDTRLYHFRNGSLQQQTMDHSVSQVSVLMGEITQDEIRFHEDRNRVLRALGSENAKPDVSAKLQLQEGDAFLLCTDGFWEYVYEKEMEETLKEAETPAQWLEKMRKFLAERVPEDHDNFSAAAVFCEAKM